MIYLDELELITHKYNIILLTNDTLYTNFN